MKNTKIMVIMIATIIITWTLISLISWILSDLSLRDCYTHGLTLFLMVVFGWIPSIVIACDLDNKLEDY